MEPVTVSVSSCWKGIVKPLLYFLYPFGRTSGIRNCISFSFGKDRGTVTVNLFDQNCFLDVFCCSTVIFRIDCYLMTSLLLPTYLFVLYLKGISNLYWKFSVLIFVRNLLSHVSVVVSFRGMVFCCELACMPFRNEL